MIFPGAVILTVLSLASVATSHPGEVFDKRQHMEELANAHAIADINARALEACQNNPEVVERRERAVARRAATFERLRKEKGLSDGMSVFSLLMIL
jgi:hypothetical protein